MLPGYQSCVKLQGEVRVLNSPSFYIFFSLKDLLSIYQSILQQLGRCKQNWAFVQKFTKLLN